MVVIPIPVIDGRANDGVDVIRFVGAFFERDFDVVALVPTDHARRFIYLCASATATQDGTHNVPL